VRVVSGGDWHDALRRFGWWGREGFQPIFRCGQATGH
jgi:hypothetical protein